MKQSSLTRVQRDGPARVPLTQLAHARTSSPALNRVAPKAGARRVAVAAFNSSV